MHTRRFVIALAAFAALAAPPRAVRAADFQGPLETAVYGWLELLDAGRFDDAWNAADPLLREGVSQNEWTAATRKLRDRFGPIASRRVATKDYHRRIDGGPDGNYFTLRIATSFAGGGELLEVVTVTTGPDQTYRTVAYGIKR